MNAFDKVIGYKATKRELLQLCDMLRNREIYEKMGARLPHGLLLYGDPGLGKTLLARCFVEESGLHTITVRRDKGGDAFIDGITDVVIPEGVTSVGKLAFACCHELTMARMSSRSFH